MLFTYFKPNKDSFKLLWLFLIITHLIGLSACAQRFQNQENNSGNDAFRQIPMEAEKDMTLEKATFGNGCFWCTEAVFVRLKGVHNVISGYSGGNIPNPTYKDVCSGLTGHAEVVQILFDPKVITYTELLEVFWNTHDPTTLNRQGNDVGTQYRSVIFYHSEQQKLAASELKKILDSSGIYDKPIVTEIVPFESFYPAEAYHQSYFENNPYQPYCVYVVAPKIQKFEKKFKEKLKKPQKTD